VVDLVFLRHLEPRAIAEGGLEQGKQGRFQQDALHLLGGRPVFTVQEVAANVN
jgi:hypothetical protein